MLFVWLAPLEPPAGRRGLLDRPPWLMMNADIRGALLWGSRFAGVPVRTPANQFAEPVRGLIANQFANYRGGASVANEPLAVRTNPWLDSSVSLHSLI